MSDNHQGNLVELFPVSPQDHLQHGRYATQLIERITRLRDGSAVALRGPWGRGKTDVLGRVARTISSLNPNDKPAFAHVFGMSPWRHPEPDILGPVLTQVAIELKKSTLETEWPLVGSMLLAVVRIGVGLTVAHATHYDPQLMQVAKVADDVVIEIGKKIGREFSRAVPFMCGEPGPQFAHLIDRVLKEKPDNARVLICIDDIDRCLPAKQMAILEAIHFLKAANLRAVFLVAVDPTLLRAACHAHFGCDAFDSDAYLDKIFDYTQDLHSLESAGTQSLIRGELQQTVFIDGQENTVKDTLQAAWFRMSQPIEAFFDQACGSTSMGSPRNIERTCRRLVMLAQSEPNKDRYDLNNPIQHQAFWLWLAATQQWPKSRAYLRDAATLTQQSRERERRLQPTSPASGHGVTVRPPFPETLRAHLHPFPELLERIEWLHRAVTTDYGQGMEFDQCLHTMSGIDSILRSRNL